MKHTNGKEKKTLGDVVKEGRNSLNKTQYWLADEIGTTQVAISRIESGDLIPSDQTIEKLSDALQMDIGVLKDSVKYEKKILRQKLNKLKIDQIRILSAISDQFIKLNNC